MSAKDIKSIMKLRVPVIVRLGHRKMSLHEVLALQPGSMLDLPKVAADPLDLMVNNKLVGHGSAVKIGENFGLKVTAVGDAAERIRAMGPEGEEPEPDAPSDDEAAAIADQMLGGADGTGPGADEAAKPAKANTKVVGKAK